MNDVQYYDEVKKTLVHPWRTKILKILEKNCLQKMSDNQWNCNPIAGYNSTIHKLERIPMQGDFKCSCQGYHKRSDCSHRQALLIHFREIGMKLEPSLF